MIKKMEKTIHSLKPVIESINWSNKHTYGNWLSQQYYIVKRSTPYLGLVLMHSNNYPEFQKRCMEHMSEEKGHEHLIENDLKNLSLSLLPELPATCLIYQPQYFKIVAESPLSFLGYVFFLELLAPKYGPYLMDQVPKNATSFLKVHSHADEDHIESATKMLDFIAQKYPDALSGIFLAHESAATAYLAMLEKIGENSHKSLMVASL